MRPHPGLLSVPRVCPVAQPEFSEFTPRPTQRTTLYPMLAIVLKVSKGLFTAVLAQQRTDEPFDWGLLVWGGLLG